MADPRVEHEVRTVMERLAAGDDRIRLLPVEATDDVAGRLNSAIATARGDYIALLGAGDQLREDALLLIAGQLAADSSVCMLYSDESRLDQAGLPAFAHFKPPWNPELILGQAYVGRLLVAAAGVVRAIGGFRPGLLGCPEHDLILRLSQACPRGQIRHLPYLLYAAGVGELLSGDALKAAPD